MKNRIKEALILGLFLFLGLSSLGLFVAEAPARLKQYERSVTVKGLAEREVPADIAIWPIRIIRASNELGDLYRDLEEDTKRVVAFLEARGFDAKDITVSPPMVTDKVAQNYGNQNVALRYAANRTITVYSGEAGRVRSSTSDLAELGRNGVVLAGREHDNATEYIFTGLNELKPAMVEEATRKAREVATKFARDSDSTLGKIKRARQGQFSVTNRDRNNPHIKKVRVVSTIEYYLSD